MNEPNKKWHCLSADAVVQELHSNASCGLSRKEARSRYRSFGSNTLFDGRGQSFWATCRPIVTDPSLLLLLFVCVLSVCFSQIASGLATALCLFGGLGLAFRLLRIEKKVLATVSKYRVPTVHLIRDGRTLLLSARAITVGDILLLRCGDVVPCDCRLIESADLCVLTLTPDENGKAKYAHQKKDAAAVCPRDGRTGQEPENMLFGGSELLTGEARAIAVAIGREAFLGGFSNFEIPAERNTRTSGHTPEDIAAYLRVYGLMLFVLMIPLTLLGILISPAEHAIWYVLQAVCALAATASPAFLLLHFQASVTHLKSRYLSEKNLADRAVIKSDSAIEGLSAVTDVIVLGHTGISDERLHLYRWASGLGEHDLQHPDSSAALTPLCEAFYLLEQAQAAHSHALGQTLTTPDFSTLRQELELASAFDRGAVEVRLLSTLPISPCDGCETALEVRMRDGDFQLFFSEDIACLSKCALYEINGKTRPLDYVSRKRLTDFVNSAHEEGSHIRIVLRRTRGEWSLLGIVALREQIQAVLPSVLEELRQCGVAVSFFVPDETPDERKFLSSAELSQPLMVASERPDPNAHLTTFYGKYRVFAGFSQNEIAELIAILKRHGRRVAVLGERTEDLRHLQNATVALASDRLAVDRPAESVAVRRRADVLIPPADRLRGGLFLLLRLISDCRALEMRTRAVFQFLYGSALLRLIISALSVCVGLRGLYGAQILFSGFLLDSLGVLLLHAASIPQNRLRRVVPQDQKSMEGILRERNNWIPHLCAAGAAVIYAAILFYCNILSQDHCVSFLFGSLILLQLVHLFSVALEKHLFASLGQCAALTGTVLFSVLAASVLAFLLDPIHRAVGLGAWNTLTFCSLPLSILVFLLVRYLLSVFLKRTAK